MLRPFCRAYFATLRVTPELISAKVIRAGFAHEVMVLRFRDMNLSSRNYRSGTPVSVEWGVFPRYQESFIGYVHHVEPTVRREPGVAQQPVVEVVAVGPSRALRDEAPRNWGTSRLDMAAARMVRKERLRLDADRTEIIHDPLMQPAESQWQFLATGAAEEGYFLSEHGTRVLLWDMEKRLPRMINTAPLFQRAFNEVRDFRPLSGETNPSEREAADRAAFALSLYGGEKGRFSGKPSGGATTALRSTFSTKDFIRPSSQFFATETGGVLDSPPDVRQELSTVRRRTARVYQAKAETSPFPPLRAGDPVVFEGYGSRQSGVWVTDEAVFSLSADGLRMSLEVSRSDAFDTGQRPRTPYGKSVYRRRPASRLVGNRWVARG